MGVKVSCILCSGYGERFVRRAIECFRSQDYAGELELVVVDNNDEPIGGLPEGAVYVRSKRMPVGALRNLGTRHATGEICLSWDEDDWYAPNRVSEQVKRLIATGKAVTGWHDVRYYDISSRNAWQYRWNQDRPYAIGMSQCYWREWWEKHPFPETGVEDFPFGDEARSAGQLDSTDAGELCVATIHGRNACPKKNLRSSKNWAEITVESLPEKFRRSNGEMQ